MEPRQILGRTWTLHAGRRSHDLSVVVLFVCCLPMLLKADPSVLRANWSAVNDPTQFAADAVFQTGFPATSLFRTLFAAPNYSFLFGFLDHLDGYSTLAIAFKPSQYHLYQNGTIRADNRTWKIYAYEVIWRANRNSRVGVNAVLKVSGGNLVLHDNDTREVWSTKLPPHKNKIASIEMQSSGNLVLADGGNRILWQSFEHPTDTLVLGANLTHKMSLVAASSAGDSSEGSYKMVMEAQGLVLYSTLGTSSIPQPYMERSLAVTFNDTLSLFHGRARAYSCVRYDDLSRTINLVIVNLEFSTPDLFPPRFFVSTPMDIWIQFGITGIASSAMVFLRLDYDGVLRMYAYREYSQIWVDNYWVKYTEVRDNLYRDSECTLLPAFCGPYSICSNIPGAAKCKCPSPFQLRNASDYTQGCYPAWNQTSCAQGSSVNPDTEMLELHDTSYLPNTLVAPTALNVTLEECKTMCLLSCSCAASFHQYDNARHQRVHNNSWYKKTRFADRTACFLVDALNSMYTILPEQDIWTSNPCPYSAFVKFSRQAVTDRTDNSTFSSAWKLAVGISSGAALFIVTATLVCVFVLRHAMSGSESGDDEEQEAFLGSLPGLPPRFSFNELDRATNHFIKVLGEGGFGTVYEGVLLDGSKVAVKRLGGSKQGQKEFRAEVATIGGINHLCLVRLWGFCSEGAHRMLVYECMDNGSLDRWLFRDTVLEWAVRYQIALDTAQGLCYLHRDCRHKIVHLDVKPQNILLDDRFRAKVADFGLSKLFDRDMSQVMTRMRGTPGYLAPEWLLQTGITEKCDVYSFGMVLLEIVSGRRNIDVCETPARWYFPAWAVQCLQSEQSWREIVDAQIQGSLAADDWEQVKKVVAIAMWCIQDAPRMRPSMARVVQMLEGVVEVDAAPLHFEFLHIASGEVRPSPISTPSVPTSAAERDHGPSMEMKVLKGSYCQPDSQLSLSPR